MIQRTLYLKPAGVSGTAAAAVAAAAKLSDKATTGSHHHIHKLHAHQIPSSPRVVRPSASSSSNISRALPNVSPSAKSTTSTSLHVDPNIKGLVANVRAMYATRGLRAFTQGFGPTIFRQVAYSGVQFTTYTAVKQAIHPPQSNDPMPIYKVVFAATLSCMAVVLATQPIDLVKTRMQSINARTTYRSTFRTIFKVCVEEGLPTFWVGFVPRFAKIAGGSAITFVLYESFDNVVRKATRENPFSSE